MVADTNVQQILVGASRSSRSRHDRRGGQVIIIPHIEDNI